MAAGSISEKKFAECAIHLLEKSAHQKDHWTGEKSSSGEIYLQKRCTVPCQLPIPTTRERTLSDTQNIKEPVEDLDEAVVQDNVSASISMVTFVYHVVYNASYAVPVLYFNAYKPVVLYSYGRVQFQYQTEWVWKPSHSTDGQLLSLEEVWAIVPQHYQDRLREERWTFITQQEHPILGRPFYQLHPCHTSTLMSQIPDTPGSNYLISWMSAIGPVLRLEMSMRYGEII